MENKKRQTKRQVPSALALDNGVKRGLAFLNLRNNYTHGKFTTHKLKIRKHIVCVPWLSVSFFIAAEWACKMLSLSFFA